MSEEILLGWDGRDHVEFLRVATSVSLDEPPATKEDR